MRSQLKGMLQEAQKAYTTRSRPITPTMENDTKPVSTAINSETPPPKPKPEPIRYEANGKLPEGYVKVNGKNTMIKKSEYEVFEAYKKKMKEASIATNVPTSVPNRSGTFREEKVPQKPTSLATGGKTSKPGSGRDKSPSPSSSMGAGNVATRISTSVAVKVATGAITSGLIGVGGNTYYNDKKQNESLQSDLGRSGV